MTLREVILTSAMVLLAGGAALCQTPAPPVPPTPAPPPVPPAPPRPVDPAGPGGSPFGAPIQAQVPAPVPAQTQTQVAPPAVPSTPGTPPVPSGVPVPAPMAAPMAAPKAKKVSEMGLDELLQSALHSHAEIVQAQAKVRDAELDLIRIRQKILVQIAVKRAEYEAAKATYNEAKVRKDAADRMLKEKAISAEDARTADLTLLKAKAELARYEASLAAAAAMAPPGVEDPTILKLMTTQMWPTPDGGGRYYYSGVALPGLQATGAAPIGVTTYIAPGTVPPMTEKVWAIGAAAASAGTSPAMSPAGTGTQKLLKKLAAPVNINLDAPTLADVIEILGQHVDLVSPLAKERLNAKAGSANFKHALPLGAAMQWVEDSFKVKLIVRDYGIVVTEPDRVPPGALTVMDVWRQSEHSLQGAAPRDVIYTLPTVTAFPPKK